MAEYIVWLLGALLIAFGLYRVIRPSKKSKTESQIESNKNEIQLTTKEELEEDELYPFQHRGFQTYSGKELIADHHYQVTRIRDLLGMTDTEWSEIALPLLERFAQYCQMIPASQSEHHRLAGGLITHSLEAGLLAADSLHSRLFESNSRVSQDRVKKEPVWRFGVFVAALLHDAGKLVSDVTVVSLKSGKRWNPFDSDIKSWLDEIGETHYIFSYNKSRGYKAHDNFSSQLSALIIPAKTKQYLISKGDDVFHSVISTLNNDKVKASEIMFDAVKQADKESSMRDLNNYKPPTQKNTQNSKADQLVWGIVSMIEKGGWGINKSGGRVFVTERGAFLVWYSNPINELLLQLSQDGVKGFPKDEEILTQMLWKARAIRKIDEATKWPVTLEVEGKKLDLVLTQILDSRLLEAVGKKLFEQRGVEPIIPLSMSKQNEPNFPVHYCAESITEAGLIEKQNLTSKATPSEAPVQEASEHSQSEEQAPGNNSKPEKPKEGAPQPPIPTEQAPKEQPPFTTNQERVKQADSIQNRKKLGKASNPHKDWFKKEGLAGNIIVSIADKVIAGDIGETQVFWCDLGLALVWEDAFAKHGLSPIKARDSLIQKGWVEDNPLKPNSQTKLNYATPPGERNEQKVIVLKKHIGEKLKAYIQEVDVNAVILTAEDDSELDLSKVNVYDPMFNKKAEAPSEPEHKKEEEPKQPSKPNESKPKVSNPLASFGVKKGELPRESAKKKTPPVVNLSEKLEQSNKKKNSDPQEQPKQEQPKQEQPKQEQSRKTECQAVFGRAIDRFTNENGLSKIEKHVTGHPDKIEILKPMLVVRQLRVFLNEEQGEQLSVSAWANKIVECFESNEADGLYIPKHVLTTETWKEFEKCH